MTTRAKVTTSEILSAERLRVAAILESPEGLRNPEAARKMVMMGFLPDQAKELLAGLPPANPYLAALDKEAAFAISPHHSADVFSSDPKEKRKQEIAANALSYAKAQGYK